MTGPAADPTETAHAGAQRWHRLRRAFALASLVLLAVPAAAQAPTADAAFEWHQPAQPLSSALTALAVRTGLLLGVDAEVVRGKRAPALQGRYTAREALLQLLEGSGLEAVRGASGGYALRVAAQRAPGPKPQAEAPAAGGALSEVTVTGGRDTGTVTEGTGSYTTDGAIGTATRLELSLRETPQSVSVLTRDRIDDQGLGQISDVLRQAPGLSFVQSGNAGTDANAVYSRGFEVENYQVDGIPQAGTWLLQTGDLAFYDRVEVVRGATGLLNGVGTPAATVNLVRKRPGNALQASASFSVGTWNRQRAELDIGGPVTADGRVRARVVAAVQDGDSWIERHHEKKRLFYGIVEADLARSTRLSAGFELQRHDNDGVARAGLPLFFSDGTEADYGRSRSAAARWAHSYQDQRQYFAALDHRFDNGWAVHAAFNRSRRAYDDVIGYALRGYMDRATGAGLGLWTNRWNAVPVQNAFDLYASGPFELFGRRHELVLGYNASRTHSDAPLYAGWNVAGFDPWIANFNSWTGDLPAQPHQPVTGRQETATRQSGAYATVRLRPTDALSVIVGARASDWKDVTRTVPLQRAATLTTRSEKGVVTPYAGVVFDLDKHWSAYASYTSIFKPQASKDRSGSYLDPLEGHAYEAGVKGAFHNERLNLSAAMFQVKQDNLAVRLDNEFAPDGSAAYRAAKGTTTRGYEFEVAGELLPGWQVGGGFAHSVARDAAGQRLNTQVPKNLLKLFTSYRIAGIGNGLTVGGGLNWQSDTYSTGLGPSGHARFTQQAYTTLDLMARYPINKHLAVSVALNNVFDTRYRTSTSSSFYGAPRHLLVTLRGTY
ncbi:TonB-dependent siderophore receptor [Variovorax boronicumulans]|uniref:TonB-dependent siderophore receptor n=1 Tax=Variovorax boronicumulans TaxID=436515 RepID=UPI0012E4C2A6|nr:TonB-dependent receptor [Variovorax boronicumulans]GER20506.1 TonB-dependent siderophore receptor [Variovorax boronicumulans]